MLKFIEVFPEVLNDLPSYKVHMAVSPTPDNSPLHAFFRGDFKKWQEWQNKKNFERPYILSFIYYRLNEWLYAGVYRSKSSIYYEQDGHYEYDTELTDMRSDLIGRLVINFNKAFRASYLILENHFDDFNVSEIMKERLSILPFPGYENVNIDYSTLKTIVTNEEITWKTALKSIKGIYLITDRSNGKHYVGGVYGKEAFWTRWSQYAYSGHGNNVELRELLNGNGSTHVENLNFSIMEIRSSITDDLEIQQRETYWKRVLLTRQFGYNGN